MKCLSRLLVKGAFSGRGLDYSALKNDNRYMKIDIPYKDIGINEKKLFLTAHRIPLKYKVYKIPKRYSGVRIIAQPTPEVKEIQRKLVGFLRTRLRIHNCATAYEAGKGIKENALKHVKNQYLLKMDLANFFNSITPDIFQNALTHDSVELDETTWTTLVNVFFWAPGKKLTGKLVLSVGAPSSPFISNYIMKRFDEQVSDLCEKLGVTYTRYADDITFSTNQQNILFSLKENIGSLLQANGYKSININESKTVFSSKAHNRHVTGVTLTNDGKLSVGRDKKRYASSLIFRFRLAELCHDDILFLKGLLAHYFHIEPSFRCSMEKKYGKDIIHALMKYQGDVHEPDN